MVSDGVDWAAKGPFLMASDGGWMEREGTPDEVKLDQYGQTRLKNL